MFAPHCIPAILAMTHNLFTACTSNILAMPSPRALFFVLVRITHLFRYEAVPESSRERLTGVV